MAQFARLRDYRISCSQEMSKSKATTQSRKLPKEAPIKHTRFERPPCTEYARRKIDPDRSRKRKGRPAKGDLFFSRENSSNGALNSAKTFWTKSYGRENGVSSTFYDLNVFRINHLVYTSTASDLSHFETKCGEKGCKPISLRHLSPNPSARPDLWRGWRSPVPAVRPSRGK